VAAALIVGACVVAAGAQSAAPRAGTGQPNVLVVMTDDQRLSDLAKAMPRTLRRIGERGTRFTDAFATFPLCCPSRASYLTGQYAHNHGVRNNHPPLGGVQAFDDSATLATALDAAGYYTGWVGKYLNGYRSLAREDPPYVPPGYDWWRAASVPRTMYGWEQVIGNRLRRWGFTNRDYQTDVYARQAEGFVDEAARKGEPFFLTVGAFAPHVETRQFDGDHDPRPARRHRGAFANAPLPRPPSFNEADVSDKPAPVAGAPPLRQAARNDIRDANRDRLASLLAVDDLVVGVLGALRRNELLGSTLVIFTSDNGYLLGEHRLRGKDRIYDPASRVPLLMRGPGVPLRTVRAPVANIDVAATIYDRTQVTPATQQDGVSLLDVAAAPGAYADRELLIETVRGTSLRTRRWAYAELETTLGTEFELYDLANDPHQLRSRHADPAYQDVRDDLEDRLDDLRDCEGGECS
jgi:N-acetylglucosamine-6-sulfatase